MGDIKEKICDVMETMVNGLHSCVVGNMECADTAEVVSIIDGIHHLAETKYYCAVTEAMEKSDEKVARKPMVDQQPYLDAYLNRGYHNMGDKMYHWDTDKDAYVYDYDDDMKDLVNGYSNYRMAKRHYTETKSIGDKSVMETNAKTHLNNLVANIEDMWVEADPTLRSGIKTDVTALLSKMA